MESGKAAASKRALEAVDHFLAEVAASGSSETVAASFNTHLSRLSEGNLPAAARDAWRRIAHLLRTPADRVVPDSSSRAMRSWPHARAAELVERIRELHAVLAKVENDRLEDEIRDSIRHHYL